MERQADASSGPDLEPDSDPERGRGVDPGPQAAADELGAALLELAGLPPEAPPPLAVDRICETEPEALDGGALQSLIRRWLVAPPESFAELGLRDRWGLVERLAFALAREGSPRSAARSRLDRALVNLARGEQRRVSRALHGVVASEALDAADRALACAGLVSLAVLERDLTLAARLAASGPPRDDLTESGLARRVEPCRDGLAWLVSAPGPAPDTAPDHALSSAAPDAGTAPGEARDEGQGLARDGGPGGEPPDLCAALFGLSEPARAADREALGRLLAWRHRLDDPAWRATAPVAEVREALEVCSRWNLPGSTRALESMLRDRDPSTYAAALLDRHLGAAVADRVTDGRAEPAGEPEITRVTLLMLDIEGYSSFCEASDPREVFKALTPIYKVLHDELTALGGWVHEFVGDGVLAVLPDEAARERPTALLQAMARVLDRARNLAALLSLEGRPFLRFGMALHSGPVAMALLGSRERCHFAVLGHTTNVTARIERLTRRQSRPLIISRSTLSDEAGRLELWRRPEDLRLSVRDPGRFPLRGLKECPPVLACDTLVRYGIDFLPMGAVVRPEPGVVVLDTGGALGYGIIDSHASHATDGAEAGKSSCRCLVEHPEWLLEHEGVRERLAAGAPETIELRVHRAPDLDCCATLTAAYELLGGDPRRDRLAELADYVDAVDSGAIPAPEQLGRSLYGVFLAHINRAFRSGATDLGLLEAGLRVVDAALFLADEVAASGGSPSLATIFAAAPEAFPEEQALIERDQALYREDRAAGLRLPMRARRRRDGGVAELAGLWLEQPRSLFFKHWARSDPEAPGGRGFGVLAVDWSRDGRRRYVISVAPDGPTDLRGLSVALDQAEDEVWKTQGRARPRRPRRPPTDLADPWYGGWGHDHTIVDAPRGGTLLNADQVKALLGRWSPAGLD